MTRLCALQLIGAALMAAASGAEGTAKAPLAVARLDLRLSADYYSGDRRLLVFQRAGGESPSRLAAAGTPARERDRLQRAGEAALDVADVLAERAGDVAQVGSMALLVPIAPEVTQIAVGQRRVWIVFATVVHVETSGRHLTTASVAATVEPDGSIIPLRTWSAAYGPSTLNAVKIVRLCAGLSASAAGQGGLVVVVEGVNGRRQFERYALSATSKSFVRRPAPAESGRARPASCR